MSEPIARDTLLNDLATDQSKGSIVHTFNPNASTAEKAAAAGKAAPKLKSVSDGSARQPQGKHLRASLHEPARRRHLLRWLYFVLTSTGPCNPLECSAQGGRWPLWHPRPCHCDPSGR
jgi:hypothetical protein